MYCMLCNDLIEAKELCKKDACRRLFMCSAET